MNLKQQIQKTEEEFDEKFVRKQSILEATEENPIIMGLEPPIEKIKQFIRQSQIEAVKAFAEEIKSIEINERYENWQNMIPTKELELFKQDINNLLKDI